MKEQIHSGFSKEALDWAKAYEEERNRELAEVNKDLETYKECVLCGEEIKGYGLDLEYFKYFEADPNQEDVHNKLSKKDGCICSSCYLKEFKIEKLYHVSIHLEPIDWFGFRIPNSRLDDEDPYIGRICLSDSISGAISGFSYANQIIYPVDFGDCYLRVYEFDIKDLPIEQIVPPEYLYQKDLVSDSVITREFWVAEKLGEDECIEPSRSYLINVKDTRVKRTNDINYKDKLSSLKNNKDCKSMIKGQVLKVKAVYEKVEEKDYEREKEYFAI
jgi:hypothetical protein